MKISPAGRDLIASFEQGPGGGPALMAYLCPAGKWTLGYGHTAGVAQGHTLPSKPAADMLLDEDLASYGREVARLLDGAPTSQHEFDALGSLSFNIGIGGLAGSTPLRLHKAGKKQEAAQSFALWNKATVGGVLQEMPGLTRRRAAETALYLTPDGDGVIERHTPMPQEVEPPKGVASSKTVWATTAGATGAATIAVSNVGPALDAVNNAVDTVEKAKTTTAKVGDLLAPLLNGHVYTVLILTVVMGLLIFGLVRLVRGIRAGRIKVQS